MSDGQHTANGTVHVEYVRGRREQAERVAALKQRVDELEADNRTLHKAAGEVDDALNDILSAVPRIGVELEKGWRPRKAAAGATEIVPVLHLSDAHHGAVQVADEVEGFGVFDPELSRARQFGFVADVLDWSEMHRRGGFSLPEARAIVTGDMISGDIHDELRVTNAFPAPVQAVEAAEVLARQLAVLSTGFERVVADVLTDDNHGRLTRKPQAKQAGLNNYMYVVARMAAAIVRDLRNVEVRVHALPQFVTEVAGRRYLVCHGHDVMGWAGFPYYGIERKVSREALKRMNAPEQRRFHRCVMGHWHAPLAHPWYWIGGSVSGTDAFDHRQGRHALPQQVSWMVHPRWGEFDRTEWLLTKHDGKVAEGGKR